MNRVGVSKHVTLLAVGLVWVALIQVACPGPRPVHERPAARATGMETLAAQLGNPQWQRRADAARKLGATRHADAVAHLAKAVRDKNKQVRLAAVVACGVHRDPRLVDPLQKALTDSHKPVRREAVRALAKIGTRGAVEAMIGCLDGASLWLRPAVVDGLITVSPKVLAGLEVAVQLIVSELVPKKKVRFRRLVRVLGAIGDPALEVLIRGMQKGVAGVAPNRHTRPDVECAYAPCRALVALGGRIIPALLRMTHRGLDGLSSRFLYRQLLPILLSRMGRPALPHLMARLGKSGDERHMAKEALSRMGALAVGPLLERLKKAGQKKTVRDCLGCSPG